MEGCPSCAPEIARLRAVNVTLTGAVEDLGRTLANVTDDCGPDAPSVAIVYWLWSDAKRSSPSWRFAWARVCPLISAAGELPAPKLSPLVWEHHRARRKLLGLSDTTLNLELLYAKQMLAWAVEHGLIKRNPLQVAKCVRTLSRRETKLTPRDIDSLLIAAEDVVDRRVSEGNDDGQRTAMLKAFLLCCHDSMMRFNEARNLRRDRIQPDGSVELLASETKSKRARVVRLTSRTLEAIQAVDSGGGYIFAGRDGLIGQTTMRKWFRRAAKMSGVDSRASLKDKRVILHDARAGGATTADENGARATAIQAVMGHADFRTTRRYLRSEPRWSAGNVVDVMEQATRMAPRKPPRRAPRKKTRPARKTI